MLRELGRGGMGTVYEVRHVDAKTRHAVKVVRSHHASDMRRFMQEARAAAPLTSPHIVHVTDMGVVDESTAYIVMDALTGESFGQAMERKISLPDLLRVICDVCGALAEAHRHGIVHRDMKPDNIFIADAGDIAIPKVLDFGIAKILSVSPIESTVNSKVLGTPDYMPPEQFDGVGVDHRADIFAVGCILYRAVSRGKEPFAGDDLPQWAAVRAQPARPLEHVAPHVLLPVAAAIMRAIEREKDDRFARMEDLIAELEPFAAKGPLPSRKARARARGVDLQDSARDLLPIDEAAVQAAVAARQAARISAFSSTSVQSPPKKQGSQTRTTLIAALVAGGLTLAAGGAAIAAWLHFGPGSHP